MDLIGLFVKRPDTPGTAEGTPHDLAQLAPAVPLTQPTLPDPATVLAEFRQSNPNDKPDYRYFRDAIVASGMAPGQPIPESIVEPILRTLGVMGVTRGSVLAALDTETASVTAAQQQFIQAMDAFYQQHVAQTKAQSDQLEAAITEREAELGVLQQQIADLYQQRTLVAGELASKQGELNRSKSGGKTFFALQLQECNVFRQILS